MLEINYTDKTGTYTILGNVSHPEPYIVNRVREVCEFCMKKTVLTTDTLCDECAQNIGEKIDRADHQNRCDW